MNTLILTRAHYRRRYGNDVPELSIPSRFLEEVPTQLVENLGGQSPAWSTPAYRSSFSAGRDRRTASEADSRHFNYEDESQEAPRANVRDFSDPRSSASKSKGAGAPPERSIDNIAHFFGGKASAGRPTSFSRPTMEIPTPNGAKSLRKGQRVMHAKYGEGTVLLREGEGEDAKLTVLFARHGMKKLIEKFANLRTI
jgi:DNA helicase-2/ATP-dependent DNA helicase PcrA